MIAFFGVGRLAFAVCAALLLSSASGFAQVLTCQGIASSPLRVIPASLNAENLVRLRFVGHATFLIESPSGIRAATDYNDYLRPSVVPDLATMNRAHSTHYSNNPDPEIKHILRGWDPGGGVARHDLVVGDMRVRSVPTNIRTWIGDQTISAGNSIFVFETAGLCIAHLGHLHHKLTPDHLAELGPIDVALVPVDGSYTLDVPTMMEVIRDIRARLVIPMHYFGRTTLQRFLLQARAHYPVEFNDSSETMLAKHTLPKEPKILVLPGR